MTDFEYMLQLFVNGAMGVKTKIDSRRTESILRTSCEHNIYYSVLSSILMAEDEELGLPAEKVAGMRAELKNVQLRTYVRMMQLAEVLKQFEAKKIPYAVLKGNTVAVFYKDPYSRVSGDVDLLVDLDDEKRATNLLLKNGFVQKRKRLKGEKHGVLVHPVIGVLELHVSLYNDTTAEVWFGNAKGGFDVKVQAFDFESLDKIEIDDMSFYTLEINKRIEHLFLHNIKHFINGGSSIRAIMDFFLTYVGCPDIDYALFYEKVKQMKFERLFNVMLSVVGKFFDFDKITVPFYEECDAELVEMFLEDMNSGRWMGYDSDGRTENSWELFEKEKREKNGHKKKKPKVIGSLKNIFPPVNRLKNNYRYSMKYPILIPVAWFHRLLRVCLRKVSSKSVQHNRYERVELLKKFNLM